MRQDVGQGVPELLAGEPGQQDGSHVVGPRQQHRGAGVNDHDRARVGRGDGAAEVVLPAGQRQARAVKALALHFLGVPTTTATSASLASYTRQPPSRRGRRAWAARKRSPRLAGSAAGHAGEDGLCGRRLAAAGDASGGAPPGAPGDPTRSEHGYLPFLQVMVAVTAWVLPPTSPWRAAPRPRWPPAARSRPGPAG
jgi:hypothetical protein